MTAPVAAEDDLPLAGPAWCWAAVAALASAPIAIGLPLSFLSKRALNLTLFDPLIWLTAAWLLLAILRRPDRQEFLRTFVLRWLKAIWPGLLLIGAGVASLLYAPPASGEGWKLAAKTAFQTTEYLLVAPWVLLELLRHRLWRQRAFWGLTLTTLAAVLAIAFLTPLSSVYAGETSPHFVGGLLGNRNTYGIFMAVALCLLAGWGLPGGEDDPGRPAPWRLLPGLLLPFAAAYPMLAAGPLLALLGGMAVTWLARHRLGFLPALLLVAFVLWAGEADERAARSRELARSIQVHRPFVDPETGIETRRPTMRYLRWYANLNMIRSNPVLGVGWGQYQKHLTPYYGDMAFSRGLTNDPRLYDVLVNEPLTFSWFFETAGETGLLGLGALLVLLGELLARALGRPADTPCWNRSGVAGAIAALFLAALWTSPMVRGAGPLLGLLLAASALPAAARATVADPQPQEE